MIEQTIEDLTPLIGTRPSCRALGASHATIYRRRRHHRTATARRHHQGGVNPSSAPNRLAIVAVAVYANFSQSGDYANASLHSAEQLREGLGAVVRSRGFVSMRT